MVPKMLKCKSSREWWTLFKHCFESNNLKFEIRIFSHPKSYFGMSWNHFKFHHISLVPPLFYGFLNFSSHVLKSNIVLAKDLFQLSRTNLEAYLNWVCEKILGDPLYFKFFCLYIQFWFVSQLYFGIRPMFGMQSNHRLSMKFFLHF